MFGGLSPGHGLRSSASLKRGSGGGAPSGDQGQTPWSGGGEAPLKLKTFKLLDAQRKQQICLILFEP